MGLPSTLREYGTAHVYSGIRRVHIPFILAPMPAHFWLLSACSSSAPKAQIFLLSHRFQPHCTLEPCKVFPCNYYFIPFAILWRQICNGGGGRGERNERNKKKRVQSNKGKGGREGRGEPFPSRFVLLDKKRQQEQAMMRTPGLILQRGFALDRRLCTVSKLCRAPLPFGDLLVDRKKVCEQLSSTWGVRGFSRSKKELLASNSVANPHDLLRHP